MPPTITADPVAAAIAAMPMPVFGLDANLRVRAANTAARRLAPAVVGDDGEPAGRPLAELLPAGAIDRVQAGILRAHALRRRQRVRPFPGVAAASAPLGLAALDLVALDDRASCIRTLVIGDDAEEDVGEEAVSYLRLIESSRDLIWSVDGGGRWTFLNGACRAIYGVGPEQLLGRPFADVVLPAQLPIDLRVFERLLGGERIVDHHTRHVRADGDVVDLLFTAEPLRDADGRIVGTVGSAQDVTQSRRNLRLIYESQWRFRKLVEVAPFAIFIKRDGAIVFANPSARQLAGRDELLGTTMMELIAPSDRARFAEARDIVKRLGRDVPPFELRMERPDGSNVIVELWFVPFTHEGDGAQLLVARDITTRRRAEDALTQERGFNEHIVRAMPMYICGVAPDGRTIFANPALCAATGYAETELVGANWWTLMYPGEGEQRVKKVMDDIHAVGRDVRDHVATLTTRGGGRRTVSWNSINRYAADGSLEMIVGLGTDITERLGLEAQLNTSQKLESIGQLAAGIAHEINTPIQFVGDNLRFLRDSFTDLAPLLATPAAAGALREGDADYLGQEIPKAIEQSIDGVTRVAAIVRAMKDFSHPDQGERSLVDLNHAVRTTLTVARNEYKYVAELETDLAADLPAVTCLVGEINQVVLNLVVNAAHAIADVAPERGRGRITVSTRRAGDHVEVRVADTGGGIPERVRPRIFEPFFTTKAVGKGTGQGLFIAHTVIVKKHGGTIAFETETGRGTTFVIRLPIEPPAALAGG